MTITNDCSMRVKVVEYNELDNKNLHIVNIAYNDLTSAASKNNLCFLNLFVLISSPSSF